MNYICDSSFGKCISQSITVKAKRMEAIHCEICTLQITAFPENHAEKRICHME